MPSTCSPERRGRAGPRRGSPGTTRSAVQTGTAPAAPPLARRAWRASSSGGRDSPCAHARLRRRAPARVRRRRLRSACRASRGSASAAVRARRGQAGCGRSTRPRQRRMPARRPLRPLPRERARRLAQGRSRPGTHAWRLRVLARPHRRSGRGRRRYRRRPRGSSAREDDSVKRPPVRPASRPAGRS